MVLQGGYDRVHHTLGTGTYCTLVWNSLWCQEEVCGGVLDLPGR